MYSRTDMLSQTGSTYKSKIDGNFAALAAAAGKRRNVNGDGQVNQLVTAVAISASWQYILDMWEAETSDAVHSSGNFGQVSDTSFPAGVGIGTSGLTTSAAVTIKFRTKIESRNCKDLLLASAFQYPAAAPLHPYVSVQCLAYQDSGQAVTVTPILRSADAADNFSSMTNALTGSAQSLPSGALTLLTWDSQGGAFQLDSLTNAANGLCLELDVAMPSGLSAKNLRIGDVQLEGGQVASYFGREDYGDLLRRCQRYYEKSYDDGVAPGAATKAGAFVDVVATLASATAVGGGTERFKATKIAVPTITLYSPVSGSSGKIFSVNDNADVTPDTSANLGGYGQTIGKSGFTWVANTLSSFTSLLFAGHWTADARL